MFLRSRTTPPAAKNTAIGFEALQNNTTATVNTATGSQALFSNTTGVDNTATGVEALFSNTNGSDTTATGVEALSSNTTGFANTATGVEALFSNTTGVDNTATGVEALSSNTTGFANPTIGDQALLSNTTGFDNTAIGVGVLSSNTTGTGNIALGNGSGSALTAGGDNIYIVNRGVAAEGNTIRIGAVGVHLNTFIAGISGVTVARGVGVIIDSNGHLGTVVSSERFKEAIKPMDKMSEAILALKPITFRYKHDLDPEGVPQFGLVAEQVEKVNPDLVVRDEQNKVYTVRYEAVNAMLLNEFLKEHKKVEQLQATVAQQQKDFQATVGRQQKQIEALTAGLQKVSAELEVSRPAPQVAAENP